MHITRTEMQEVAHVLNASRFFDQQSQSIQRSQSACSRPTAINTDLSFNIVFHKEAQLTQMYGSGHRQETQSWTSHNSCSRSLGAPEAALASSMMPLRSTLVQERDAGHSASVGYLVGYCFGYALAGMALRDARHVQRRCVDRVQAMEPRWGVLYFAYDWFSAIRTDMVREVRCVLPLLSYAISCTHPANICSARMFVRASTTG